MKMKLTWFKIIAGAVTVTAALSTFVQAQDKVKLKFADQFSLTHAASKDFSQPFIALIEERSGGRIDIQHFPAQQLAKSKGMLDAVRNRVTDIGLVGFVYNADKMPLTSGVELPGLFTDSVAGSVAFSKLVQDPLMAPEYEQSGVRLLFGTVTPPYQLMFSKRTKIDDISDLAGVKLRVAGSTGELIAKSLGAVPVRIASSDLYLSLERGTVDGAIFNSISALAYNLNEVAASITSNASLGSVAFGILVNADAWQELPEDVRKIVEDAAVEAGLAYVRTTLVKVGGANDKLAGYGLKIIELSPKVQAQFAERLAQVESKWLEQVNGRGKPGTQALAAYKSLLIGSN